MLRWAVGTLSFCVTALTLVYGLSIYVSTVLAAYEAKGLWLAVVAAVTPIASSFVLFAIHVWRDRGIDFGEDWYTSMIMVWLVLCLAHVMLRAWLGLLKPLPDSSGWNA